MNPVHILGWIVVSLCISWVIYIAFRKTGYRLFCRTWWKDVLTPHTYIYELKHYYQRLRYGISDSDIWSFDTYMLGVMIIGLKHLKECDLVADHISEKEWRDMIEGIESIDHIYKCLDIDCPMSHKQIMIDFNKGMQLFTRHFTRLWI
jgi:hypothetical protein